MKNFKIDNIGKVFGRKDVKNGILIDVLQIYQIKFCHNRWYLLRDNKKN